MKTNFFTLASGAMCGLALGLNSVSAAFNFNYDPLAIPDGSSVGVASVIHVSGEDHILSSGDNVRVTLDVSGGFNGDLYCYLSFGGKTVELLNRPGVTAGNTLGYTDAGLLVTLRDGSINLAGNINTYGSSSYSTADGQVTGDYNSPGGTTAFQTFNGLSANGAWTLFFADLSGGDGGNTSTLNGWTLDLTTGPLSVNPVPEPVNVALAVFGVLLVGARVIRHYRRTTPVAGNHPPT